MKKLLNLSTFALVMLLITISAIYQPLMAHYSHASGDLVNANPMACNAEVIHNIPLDATFYNECCDEEVYVAGTATIMINPNVIHITVLNVTGVGLSTNELYETIGAQGETNIFYNSQEEGTLVFWLKMRNDNGCSFKLRGVFHITVNANGDVASAFFTTETQCLHQ